MRIACLETNRNFIGFELQKEYFEAGQKRVKNFKTKEKEQIFSEPKKEEEKDELFEKEILELIPKEYRKN